MAHRVLEGVGLYLLVEIEHQHHQPALDRFESYQRSLPLNPLMNGNIFPVDGGYGKGWGLFVNVQVNRHRKPEGFKKRSFCPTRTYGSTRGRCLGA